MVERKKSDQHVSSGAFLRRIGLGICWALVMALVIITASGIVQLDGPNPGIGLAVMMVIIIVGISSLFQVLTWDN